LIGLAVQISATDLNEDDIHETINGLPLTCSSTIRLRNERLGFYLHSSELNYGSGSGQQIVTAFEGDSDYNSLWTVKEQEAEGEPLCRTGAKLKCGAAIRLEHMNTGRNLHSHAAFQSPVTGRQEVSAFGNQGDGDGGDNWIIECDSEDVEGYIYGKTKFYLKHRDTGNYLYSDTNSKYTENNCRRCPIVGHSEISSQRFKAKNGGLWKIHSGFFFPDIEARSDEY
jgi:dolichyl-phosphate-mannose--protein O-mannosyl transferase